jgi:flagellar FliL protein
MAEKKEPTEAAAPAAEPAVADGGKKKLIVMIVIAVLLVGGIAGGAAWFFSSRGHAEQADSGDDGKAEAKDAKHGKEKSKEKKEKKAKKPSGPAIYYKIDPALVVNFDANGVTRFLQVAIEVSTRDPETAEALKLHDPVIRNDLLMLLGSQTEATVSTREAKEALRAQALTAVRNVIANEGGEGEKVENVYFTSFVMQ